ncbi:hypothetical protein ACQKWADRAFT_284677 [Trichoderma austrokoningii]
MVGLESYQGVWKWRSGFLGNLGGWWKPPCKKDGNRLFTISFLTLPLSPCCSHVVVVYRTCAIIIRRAILCGIWQSFLSFIYFRVL